MPPIDPSDQRLEQIRMHIVKIAISIHKMHMELLKTRWSLDIIVA
jgi:hypothetical protein